MDEGRELMGQSGYDVLVRDIWSLGVAELRVGPAFRLRRARLGHRSGFDAPAPSPLRVQPRGDDAIGLLLAAASLPPTSEALPNNSIWAQEAVHRAYATVKLFLRLHERQTVIDRFTHTIERRLASDIGRIFRSLHLDHVPNATACGSDVRDIARDLVALFGPALGDIVLDCNIERVALPPDERRALVLLTHELVANALLHAFDGRRRGWIVVRLRRVCSDSIHLCVEDDGIGLPVEGPNQSGVAYMLAHRLGAAISYTRSAAGLTCVDVVLEPDHQIVD